MELFKNMNDGIIVVEHLYDKYVFQVKFTLKIVLLTHIG